MKKNEKKIAVGIVLVVVIALGIFIYDNQRQIIEGQSGSRFSSEEEIKNYLLENSGSGTEYYSEKASMFGVADGAQGGSGAATPGSRSSEEAEDYSQTNVQVEGVDEPDIVKNDGKYIYTVNGKKVVILNAFPAEEMEIVSEIEIKGGVRNIFVNGDKLIVFSEDYDFIDGDAPCPLLEGDMKVASEAFYPCGGYSKQFTEVFVYDISDRENPELENEFKADGWYVDARMIGDYIYFISTKDISFNAFELPAYEINGVTRLAAPSDVVYFDYYDDNYVFTSVSSINLGDGGFDSEVYLIGYTSTVFVSENNIYLTSQKRVAVNDYLDRYADSVLKEVLLSEEYGRVLDVLNSDKTNWDKSNEINEIVKDYSDSLKGEEKSDFASDFSGRLDEFSREMERETQKTVIHKISVDSGNVKYVADGEVYGTVLNQFSMDESEGYFRIATTTGEIWQGTSENHIFVLDEDLNLVGSLENLAPGERIYSARFIGDRVYLVTFKKVDPFFVIDLSDVNEPRVLGYLKIPGYSDYLHPYDETHVIGIGKEAIDASENEVEGRELDFAWYQGLKIAVFDVSDVENPVESAKIVIGDRGTDSTALYDHKAFLFDREKNLLVLPVNLAKIDETQYKGEIPANAYGEMVWQGAFVLDITENDIKERGRITHIDPSDETEDRYGYRYYDWNKQIQRSLFMDDVLYTISNAKVKANNLNSLSEINSVKLPYEQPEYLPVY